MVEKVCNLWLEPAAFRCILTNGSITPAGEAILEHRTAQEAVSRYAGVAQDLGHLLASRGNQVHVIRPGVVSFPVMQSQYSLPSLPIIERSARQLVELVGSQQTLLPRPGCDAGQLAWEDVAKVLAFLPDNIIVIQYT